MQHAIVRYPLSHPQKRIWYNEQIYPNTAMYNIGGMVRIKGIVNFSTLEKAIQLFIKKNDGLRPCIHQQYGEPMQSVQPYEPEPLKFIDFSSSHYKNKGYHRWAEEEFQKPFSLEEGPLYEFVLLKINEFESAYFVKFHHIVADGWTIQLMTRQIIDYYHKLNADKHINDEVEYSYLQYLENEKKYLVSPRFKKNKDYWNEKFRALPELFLSKTSNSQKGKRKRIHLEKEQTYEIQSFLKKNRISMNTLFTALMLIYLQKIYKQPDIILGTPVLNRSGIIEKKIAGMFTSTMPLRVIVDENESVLDFIRRVNDEKKQSFFHQRYPYNLLVKDLELAKRGYDGLFQYNVNYYNTRIDSVIDGLSIENIEFYSGFQTYSLQLVIKEWNEEVLELQYDYKVEDFNDEQICRMHERFKVLLEQILNSSGQSIQELSIVTMKERKFVLEHLNQTKTLYPSERTIQELFEEQVNLTPTRVAIRFADKTMTYSELNKRSNQLARKLQAIGVTRGQVVGILAKHSLELVVSLWGVIKAGATYLPIDPSYPLERIRYILHDSDTGILLTDQPNTDLIGYEGKKIDICNPQIYVGDASNLVLINCLSDPVYLIYTSGTTGNPKGTVIPQRGLVNYISWAKKTYISGEDDVFALYSSISFDLTVTSIFTPLVSGLLLVIYHDHADEFILSRILRDNLATILKVTPSHLALLNKYGIKGTSLRKFIVGGEDLKTELAEKVHHLFEGKIEIYNEYGPTETVVGCMMHKYRPGVDQSVSVPIGSPIDNVQIYLLDQHLQPVPIGMAGEIYISGDGVAEGYLNQPELTAERFLDNPFLPGKRMYRSGDLAFMSDDGTIEYRGRFDSQVKIKGYRIELGEIEQALLQHISVQETVVVDWKDGHGSYQLIAYVVLANDVQEIELRSFLEMMLPNYMIPSFFVRVVQLPLTTNGKLDLQALPDPFEGNLLTNSVQVQGVNERTLQTVCEVMEDILQVNHVEPMSNFFHLGGDSVKAIQLVARLKEMGLKLRIKDVLNYPIVVELAAILVKQNEKNVSKAPIKGKVWPTPIMRWFFNQQFQNPHHWNQSVVLSIKKPVNVEHINEMLSAIARHHDILRLQYDEEQKILYHHDRMLTNGVEAKVYNFSNESFQYAINQVREFGDKLKASINLNEGPLFKAALFQLPNDRQWLLLTAHHLVIDAVSWLIMIEDANRCLEKLLQGEIPVFPEKTSSFQAWSEALCKSGVEQVRDEILYWKSINRHSDNTLNLDEENASITEKSCVTLSFTLDKEKTVKLLTVANTPYKTQPIELLLAALVNSLGDWTSQDYIKLELEGHGREELFDYLDISRTVGWFTTLYPAVFQVLSGISDQIVSVKEELRKIPNKGIGYGLLQKELSELEEPTPSAIRFNYLGEIANQLDGKWLTIETIDTGADKSLDNHTTAFLDIVALVKANRLELYVTFSADTFKPKSIEKLFSTYLNRLDQFIQYCSKAESREFSSSDFETVKLSKEELENLLN